jgi:hypothetical protein
MRLGRIPERRSRRQTSRENSRGRETARPIDLRQSALICGYFAAVIGMAALHVARAEGPARCGQDAGDIGYAADVATASEIAIRAVWRPRAQDKPNSLQSHSLTSSR